MAPQLLAQLKLKGCVVTGDALYAQRELSRQVVEQGGEYFWVLKDNQPSVREAIALLFAQPPWGEQFAAVCQKGRHGDRQEVRQLWASTALNDYLDWPYLQQVCCVERTRTRKAMSSQETAYAITSLSPAKARAPELLQVWRGHWAIENKLHWVRDVTMDEDRCQIRSGAAPQAMAACRNLVIGLLRRRKVGNIAAALRTYAGRPGMAVALVLSGGQG